MESLADTGERNYLSGDCQKLANALADVAAYQITGIADIGGYHLAVILENGRYLDWQGVQTRQQIETFWETRNIERSRDISETGWLGLGYATRDLDAARKVLTDGGLWDDTTEMLYDYHLDKLQDDER